MIKIEIDDKDFQRGLNQIKDNAKSDKIWAAIGEKLLRSHRKRFNAEIDAQGNKWQARSSVSNKIRSKSQPKPKHHSILKHQGRLSQTLRYQIDRSGGHSQLLLGSDLPYAAIHQFGGKFKMFGKTQKEMPARPFLGISRDDQNMILKMIAKNLLKNV